MVGNIFIENICKKKFLNKKYLRTNKIYKTTEKSKKLSKKLQNIENKISI